MHPSPFESAPLLRCGQVRVFPKGVLELEESTEFSAGELKCCVPC